MSHSKPCFGWAGLDIQPIVDRPGYVSMTLLDFAYETEPGVAITVVPEAGAWLLVGAVAACACAVKFPRRT